MSAGLTRADAPMKGCWPGDGSVGAIPVPAINPGNERTPFMPSAKTTFRAVVALFAAATGIGLAAVPAAAGPTPAAIPDGPALARQLVNKVDVANTNRHLIALQRIADRNRHTRAAGTNGYTQPAEHVAPKLQAAGHTGTRQAVPL